MCKETPIFGVNLPCKTYENKNPEMYRSLIAAPRPRLLTSCCVINVRLFSVRCCQLTGEGH